MAFNMTMPILSSLSGWSQHLKKHQQPYASPPHKSTLLPHNGHYDVFLKPKPTHPALKHSHVRTSTTPQDTVTVRELLSDQFEFRDTRTNFVFRPNLTQIKIVPRVQDSPQGTHYEIANKHVRDKNQQTLFVYNVENEKGPFQVKISGKMKDLFSQKEVPCQTNVWFDHLGLTGKTLHLERVQPKDTLNFNYREYLKEKFQSSKGKVHPELTEPYHPEDLLTFDPTRNYFKDFLQEQDQNIEHFSDVES